MAIHISSLVNSLSVCIGTICNCGAGVYLWPSLPVRLTHVLLFTLQSSPTPHLGNARLNHREVLLCTYQNSKCFKTTKTTHGNTKPSRVSLFLTAEAIRGQREWKPHTAASVLTGDRCYLNYGNWKPVQLGTLCAMGGAQSSGHYADGKRKLSMYKARWRNLRRSWWMREARGDMLPDSISMTFWKNKVCRDWEHIGRRFGCKGKQ